MCDSTVIVLTDEGLQDTLRLRYTRKRIGRGAAPTPKESLMKSLCSGQTAYYDELWLGFTNPIIRYDEGVKATVTSLKDSNVTQCSLMLDSSGLRARFATELKAYEEYRIHVPAGMFTDIYGNVSDTLQFTLKPKDYAILTVHIGNHVGTPLVVELLDGKDTVVSSRPLAGSGTVRFDHVAAGSYKMRVLVDVNGDESWTTGSYPLRRQPEEFIYFDKTLQLRERWEMEERWEVRK
jgi:hypothetical protein